MSSAYIWLRVVLATVGCSMTKGTLAAMPSTCSSDADDIHGVGQIRYGVIPTCFICMNPADEAEISAVLALLIRPMAMER